MNVPVLIRHNCGYEFLDTIRNIMRRVHSCPECFPNGFKITNAQAKDRLALKWGNEYVYVTEWAGGYNPITIRHTTCGYEWTVQSPTRWLSTGNQCPECQIEADKLPLEEVQRRIAEWGNNEYTIISEFIRTKTPIIIQHSCGDTKEVRINALNNYGGCNKCYGNMSIGEKRINDILEISGIEFKREVRIPQSNGLRFDFAIYGDNKTIIKYIEFDGQQHYDSTKFGNENDLIKRQINDYRKNAYCIHNKIPLLRIPYWNLNIITIEMLLEEESFSNIDGIDLIAIDQATTSGISIWQDKELIDYFSKTLTSEGDARINELQQFIEGLILTYYPKKIVFEEVLDVDEQSFKSKQTFELLCYYQAMLIETFIKYSIPYNKITASAWKKTLGVQGKYRKEQKSSCKDIINSMFTVNSEDVCDAIGIGYHALYGTKNRRMKEEDMQWK